MSEQEINRHGPTLFVATFQSQDTGMTPDKTRADRYRPNPVLLRLHAWICQKNIHTSWVDQHLAKHHPELNNAIYQAHELESLPDVDVKMIFNKISVAATAEGAN